MELIKDLIIMTKDELDKGTSDLDIIINGKDLIDEPIEDGWKILQSLGIVKDNKLILPIGTKIINKKTNEGSEEFTFQINDHILIANLMIEQENEYMA